MSLVLLVIAIVFEVIAAILGFRVFGSSATLGDILGVAAVGLACFMGAFLAGPIVPLRGN